MLKTAPCVFAVGDTYQIAVPVTTASLVWIKVGEKCYYDASNGVMRSGKMIHKITVPAKELDAAGQYTVCEREIIERKAYFTETREAAEYTYQFIPVKSGRTRFYHIADAHNLVSESVQAAKTYGEIDFLILNGDIQDSSQRVEAFDVIYEIAAQITKGEKPVVFARGNHDLRGVCAEVFEDYTPTGNGKTYYTFRLGSVWGLVLDFGEDKQDEGDEYGHTICCRAFREAETEFIKQTIQNAGSEYLQEGVQTKLVIAHVPFNEKHEGIFDIENDICDEWIRLLRENIKPDMMICGHEHKLYVSYPGDEKDFRGEPCPVVVASERIPGKEYFAGGGFEFDGKSIICTFTSSEGKKLKEFTL